jgi:hypothetical protein
MVEVELHCGQMLYVPPYWWYSIQYHTTGQCPRQSDYRLEQNKPGSFGLQSVVIEHTYATYMNRLASIGDLARHWLQRQTTMQIILRTFQGAKEESEQSTTTETDDPARPMVDDSLSLSLPVPIPPQESIEIP